MKQIEINETTKYVIEEIIYKIYDISAIDFLNNITINIPISDEGEIILDKAKVEKYYCGDKYEKNIKVNISFIKKFNDDIFKIIDTKTPYIFESINKAIDEYNDVNGNSEDRQRETYTLKDGFMSTYFEGFEFEYKVNRICVAKVIDKEKEYINWIAKKGYNLNNIKRGDIIMVKKMEAFKNRDLDKIFYKVISISKDKIICEYAHGDKVYTTYLKALKG